MVRSRPTVKFVKSAVGLLSILIPRVNCEVSQALVILRRRAVASALEHSKKPAPRTHSLTVLVRHNP